MKTNITYQKQGGKAFYGLSVYYTRASWPALISYIQQFHHQQRHKLDYCLMYLSEKGGDNIQISFACDEMQVMPIYQAAEAYFSVFLREKPSQEKDSFSYGDALWCNFPNNSLQWNVYDVSCLNWNYSQVISDLLPTLLNEDASEDTTYSSALFLGVKLYRMLDVEKRACLMQDLKDRISKEFQIDKDAKVIDENVVQDALTSYWDLEPDDEAYMQWIKGAQMLLRSDNPHLFYGLLTNIYRHLGLKTVYYQWGLYYLYQFLQGRYK